MLENISLPFAAVYPDGRLVLCNNAFSALTGYTKEELSKLRLSGDFTPEEWHEQDEELRRVLRLTGRTQRYEKEYQRKDGKRVPVELFMHRACDADGNLLFYYSFVLDITKRKLAEKEIWAVYQRLMDIIEFLPDPTFVIDKDKKVIAWNKAMENMVGVEKKDIIGKGDYFYSIPFYGERRPILIDIIFNSDTSIESNYNYLKRCGNMIYGETYIQTFEGKGAYLWGKASPLYDTDGSLAGAIESIRDITDIKYAEEELRKSRDELEKKVQERTAEIRKANEKLMDEIAERTRAEEALSEARMQAEMYIDLMGHDINNMNQIGIGYIEMALETFNFDENARSMISKSLNILNNSSTLINNVRKIQQAKNGQLEQEMIDVGKMLGEVAMEYSSIPGKYVNIHYTPVYGCAVQANELLKDVFANIVENAIKHSCEPLEIQIEITITKVCYQDKVFYRISISDNGPGITDEMKKTIFDRFKRGNTKAKGRGLGLYLVRTLVNDFHGKVWIEDRVPGNSDMGSKFIIELPAADN
nr:PAS domain-containing sensor histidine kinase [Methanocella sp. CWC-04]